MVCRAQAQGVLLAAALFGLTALPGVSSAQPITADAPAYEVRIVAIEGGPVEVLAPGATDWIATITNAPVKPNFHVRTGRHTRAKLTSSTHSVFQMGPLTEVVINAPRAGTRESFGMELIRGLFSFFHRDQPALGRILSNGMVAGVEGTEFAMEVNTNGPTVRVTLSVVDGIVRFSNNLGFQVLTNEQESFADAGTAPSPPVGFNVNNRLQWCFYYPAVLDLRDLPLTPAEETLLAGSLRAYRLGDLLSALRLYPAGRVPGSDAESVYYAAVLLSVGQVPQTEAALAALPANAPTDRIQRLATALRVLIAAVKLQPSPLTRRSASEADQLSTELLAASYYEQSLAVREKSLETALDLARRAATNSPNFGFAWARVAELEFSFGRTARAEEAFEKSYELSPRNAEALSLEGFLLAAQNKTRDAITWFNYAIGTDSSLGNAWLGRGLCRIHQGDLEGGREDILVAAALEPQRALLRSYLGKAYGEEADYRRAVKELDRAKYLDPKDPTSWLYSALLNQQYNRVNEAIRDLEQSLELNDNRSVYRSGLLLDEDRGVRSANLAAIYHDAGMLDLSVREASRAVSYDYANYSAHLFLANSYSQLVDPNLINLRYETPAETEYLLANLLSPIGARTLSANISQQEYSKLFEQEGVGLISSTEYLSRGAWTQNGAQFGTIGNFSYDLEAMYRSDPGDRKNNDIEQRQVSVAIKDQLSRQDSIYFQIEDFKQNGGDLAQYFDPATAGFGIRTREREEPGLLLGLHHEWGPGIHTLFLASRFADDLSVKDSAERTLYDFAFGGISGNEISDVREDRATLDRGVVQDIYSTELQQILQGENYTTIIGSKFQWGQFHARNLQTDPVNLPIFPDPAIAAMQDMTLEFQRTSLYGYHHWQVFDSLMIIGGLSFDDLRFPENMRNPPLSAEVTRTQQISPKAGMIWAPFSNTVLRAAYTRSLGGAAIDQSVRLEPTDVAGFNQAFRSVIPESIAGAISGAKFETYGLSIEQKFRTGTYVSLAGEMIGSTANRSVGVFRSDATSDFAFASQLRQSMDYREPSLILTGDQLLGEYFTAGVRYQVTDASLKENFIDIPDLPPDAVDAPFRPRQDLRSILQQLMFHASFNHPSGFFATADLEWYLQDNSGYDPSEPDEKFWQINLAAGFRFPRRQAEVAIGMLNIGNANYRLSPLTLYNELPRSRTLFVSLRLNF